MGSNNIVQSATRLSESALWQHQERFYQEQGNQAWKNQIPFYVSSNPFVAHQYADAICRYLLDCERLGKSIEHFTLLEIGGGPGKLTFYLLKALQQCLASYQLKHKFDYIFSDIVQKNIDNIQHNESFKPFIDAEILHTGLFNVRTDSDFTLSNGQSFKQSVKGPCIIIASYAFDCTPQDCYERIDNQWYQSHCEITSRFKEFNAERIQYLNDMVLNYKNEPLSDLSCYDDPDLQAVFMEYTKRFDDDGAFMFPLTTLKSIKSFASFSQDCLVLMGDKGFSNAERTHLWDTRFRSTYDGCYSFSINFDLVGRLVDRLGGDSLLSFNENSYKINLYLLHDSFKKYPLLSQYFHHYIDVHGPCDHCDLYEDMAVHGYRFSYASIIGFLKQSYWDPQVYYFLHDRIVELLPALGPMTIHELEGHVQRVCDNCYASDLEYDTLISLSQFYIQLSEQLIERQYLEKALELAKFSVRVHGSSHSHLTVASIQEDLANPHLAIQSYEEAIKINKSESFAKERLRSLEGKPYMQSLGTFLRAGIVLAGIGVVVYWLSM